MTANNMRVPRKEEKNVRNTFLFYFFFFDVSCSLHEINSRNERDISRPGAFLSHQDAKTDPPENTIRFIMWTMCMYFVTVLGALECAHWMRIIYYEKVREIPINPYWKKIEVVQLKSVHFHGFSFRIEEEIILYIKEFLLWDANAISKKVTQISIPPEIVSFQHLIQQMTVEVIRSIKSNDKIISKIAK